MTNEERQEFRERLKEEIEKWQSKIDEARVQMHLAGMEIKEKIEPHLEDVDIDWDKVKGEWKKFQAGSGNALRDIEHGMTLSFKAMKKAFEDATEHFKEEYRKEDNS